MKNETASILAIFTALLLPAYARATDPADLCTGNPCIVSSSKRVDTGTLDFGPNTELRIARGTILSIGDIRQRATVTLVAGSIVVESGARIEGRGGYSVAENRAWSKTLTLRATAGPIEVQRGARLDFRHGFQNDVFLDAAEAVVVDGAIDNSTSTFYGFLKNVTIVAGNTVRVAGSIRTDAALGTGGRIEIDAAGDVFASGKLSAQGGDGGGTINLASSTGSVVIDERVSASGKGKGDAGVIAMSASGDVTVRGDLLLRGSIPGYLQVTAGGTARIAAGVFVDLRGTRFCGGGLELDAGEDLVQEAGSRIVGCANSSLAAGADVTLGRIDLRSPITIWAAPSLVVTAGGTLRVTDAILGLPRSGLGEGTAVSLTACNLLVDVTSTIEGQSNILRAANGLLVEGELSAAEQNLLEYNASAPIITGVVNPSPTVVLNSALNCDA